LACSRARFAKVFRSFAIALYLGSSCPCCPSSTNVFQFLCKSQSQWILGAELVE
jgi:hypothetical protein